MIRGPHSQAKEPCASCDEHAQNVSSATTQRPVEPGLRPRALIVEDEGIVALELQERLSAFGFDVVGVVASGEEALARANDARPDLVLMDVRLKGELDGTEVARRLHAELDAAVVFLTAYADTETVSRAMSVDPIAYLTKPFDERTLFVTVQMALHRLRADRERARAVESQREIEAMSFAVLDSTHDGIVCIDAVQCITLFNHGAERTFGWAADEVLGQPLDLLLPPAVANSHRRLVDTFGASNEAPRPMGGRREIVGRKRDGTLFPAEVTLSQFERKGARVYIACVRDISDRKVLERNLVHAQKMEVVGRLSASVAHDFNNLLAAIQANLHLLKLSRTPETESVIEDIGLAVERGVALTRQLLGLSRSEGSPTGSHELSAVVARARSLISRLLPDNVTLIIEEPPVGRRMFVDYELVDLALLNLAINARDAMPHGGTIRLKTGARDISGDGALTDGTYAVVEASDTGTGIPPELVDRIFEPFFTTKPPGLGTGLGLSMIREIARRAGGDLRLLVSSEDGTIFQLLLPIVSSNPPPSGAQDRSPSSGPPGWAPNTRVLLIEDDAAVARALERVLSTSGFTVFHVADEPSALTAASDKTRSFDIVLSDVSLPGADGIELGAAILKQREVPIVFMTGYSPESVGERAARLGGATVLHKPVAPLALLQALREALRGRTPGGPSR